ncbi:hypothetical protein SKAU_G00214870 [Synaphobranchus kaupii]|uniref:Uncharacterized protein n=1 Tax=Synaphobranchus kaupii TaxID=118154 RepID=A0A9Q1F9R1_SYNKA|nr:hypothetical protein SKAU_G00214870 [Synaphobranchus kaupii]
MASLVPGDKAQEQDDDSSYFTPFAMPCHSETSCISSPQVQTNAICFGRAGEPRAAHQGEMGWGTAPRQLSSDCSQIFKCAHVIVSRTQIPFVLRCEGMNRLQLQQRNRIASSATDKGVRICGDTQSDISEEFTFPEANGF